MKKHIAWLGLLFSATGYAAFPERIFVWGTVTQMGDQIVVLQTKSGPVKIPRSAWSKQPPPKAGEKAGAYTTLGALRSTN